MKRIQTYFSAMLALAALALIAVLISMLVNPAGNPAAAKDPQQAGITGANPTEQAFLAEKAARLQGMLGMGTGGLEATKPADPCAMRPKDDPTPAKMSMIVQLGGELDELVNMRVLSVWQGPVMDQWVRFYTGLTNEADPVGAVYVVVENTLDAMEYRPPAKVGALTIDGVKDGRVWLRSADGFQLYFDIPGRVFTSAPDQKVQPLAPLPTLVPTPAVCP